jgi:hypothetical protein
METAASESSLFRVPPPGEAVDPQIVRRKSL